MTKADLEARVTRLEKANAKLKATARGHEATVSELEREVARLKRELSKARRAEAAETEVPLEAAEPTGDTERVVDMEAQAANVEVTIMDTAYAGGGRDTTSDVVGPTGEGGTGAFGERGAAPDDQVDEANSPPAETDGPVR